MDRTQALTFLTRVDAADFKVFSRGSIDKPLPEGWENGFLDLFIWSIDELSNIEGSSDRDILEYSYDKMSKLSTVLSMTGRHYCPGASSVEGKREFIQNNWEVIDMFIAYYEALTGTSRPTATRGLWTYSDYYWIGLAKAFRPKIGEAFKKIPEFKE